MSIAIDTVEKIIQETREQCAAVPHGIKYVDQAIGQRYELLMQVKSAIIKAESREILEGTEEGTGD